MLIQPALDADPMDEKRVARVVREAFAPEPLAWEDGRYGLRVGVPENLDVPEHTRTVHGSIRPCTR